MTTENQLLPCPFCGEEPHDAHHIEYGRWAVTCQCGVHGTSASAGPNATDELKIKAYSDARAAWNRRAALTQPAQPAEGGEAVGEAQALFGTPAFTHCTWDARVVPHGTKLYTAPPSSQEQAGAHVLLDALRKLSCLGNGDQPGNSDGNLIAQRALDAWEEWADTRRLVQNMDRVNAERASQEQAQQPSGPHLFEFWWETHMPQATQAEAWAAWQAAPTSKGVGIERQPSGGEAVAEPGTVYVDVSGFTGTGKSAVAGEIEIAMRAIGLQVEWVDGQAEKNMTGADWAHALEMYKPRVVIRERNIPLTVATPKPQSSGGEVVAWRLRAPVESCGLQRFMTQAKYEKQTPAIQKWYEPFKCQNCATPKPEPMTDEQILKAMSDAGWPKHLVNHVSGAREFTAALARRRDEARGITAQGAQGEQG